MEDFSYELDDDTLTIYVNTSMWSIDLLPTWLSEIFTNLWLEDAERIRHIKIEMKGA